MKLKNISSEFCPHCGSTTVAESIQNGEERRNFDCGLVLHHIPDLKLVEEEKQCSLDNDILKKIERREKCIEDIKDYVLKYKEVDDDFKVTFISELMHFRAKV